MSMLSVFLSYSHDDEGAARIVASRLEAAGLLVWWDRKIAPSTLIHHQIDENLKSADKVIVLWSPRSVASSWVIAEAEYAAGASKIVSVRIEPCEPPIRFTVFNYLDVADPEHEAPRILAALFGASQANILQAKSSLTPGREAGKRELFLGLAFGRFRIGLVLATTFSFALLSLPAVLELRRPGPELSSSNSKPALEQIAGVRAGGGEGKSLLDDIPEKPGQIVIVADLHAGDLRERQSREEAKTESRQTAQLRAEAQRHEEEARREAEHLAELQRTARLIEQALNERAAARRAQDVAAVPALQFPAPDPTLQPPDPAQSRRHTGRYESVSSALDQGVSAYGSGHYELALDPLEYAASHNDFLAQYFLARIYADSLAPRTDHARAYNLYQRLADTFADVDPGDQRAPFVAKILTALAGYLQTGLSNIGLKPDPTRAAEYLHHAASFFNDEDAQFQLSKLILLRSLGPGSAPRDEKQEKLAVHWLSTLTTERKHAGAQAFLAYLMWRGEHEPLIRKDPQRALALVTVAAENAPASERIWIEDYYQEIYCGISASNRKKLDGLVASYRQQYGRQYGSPADDRERSGLGGLMPEAERTCRDGEPVPPIRRRITLPAKTSQEK